jgi:hypothetical protein
MGLRLLARALLSTLTTRASVKLLLGIAASDTSKDAILDELIAGVGDSFALHVGRDLVRQKYLESDPEPLVGDPTRVYLARFPIDRDQVTLTIDGAAETDFEVEDAATGLLYREGGWPTSDVEITYFAGYVSPDQVSTWVNGMTPTKGHFVRPTSAAVAYTAPLLFEATTVTGAAAGSEPNWPTTGGQTVVSGNVTFTARDAEEVPLALRSVAFLETKNRFERRERAEGLRSFQVESYAESYVDEHSLAALSPSVLRSLELWKHGR